MATAAALESLATAATAAAQESLATAAAQESLATAATVAAQESMATAAAQESMVTAAAQESMATAATVALQESKAIGATPRLDRRRGWLVRGAPCSGRSCLGGSSRRNAARASAGMLLLHIVRVFVWHVSRRMRRPVEG